MVSFLLEIPSKHPSRIAESHRQLSTRFKQRATGRSKKLLDSPEVSLCNVGNYRNSSPGLSWEVKP